MWVMGVELGPSDLVVVGFNMLIYSPIQCSWFLNKFSFALIFFFFVGVHIWRPEVSVESPYCFCLIFFLRVYLSLNLEVAFLAKLGISQAPGLQLPLPPLQV